MNDQRRERKNESRLGAAVATSIWTLCRRVAVDPATWGLQRYGAASRVRACFACSGIHFHLFRARGGKLQVIRRPWAGPTSRPVVPGGDRLSSELVHARALKTVDKQRLLEASTSHSGAPFT